MPDVQTITPIGLGKMDEALCRNIARKAHWQVLDCNLRPEPLEGLATDALRAAARAPIPAIDPGHALAAKGEAP